MRHFKSWITERTVEKVKKMQLIKQDQLCAQIYQQKNAYAQFNKKEEQLNHSLVKSQAQFNRFMQSLTAGARRDILDKARPKGEQETGDIVEQKRYQKTYRTKVKEASQFSGLYLA